MRSTSLALAALALLLVSAGVQKRVKAPEAADFPATLSAAGAAWDAGELGTCVKELRTALGLATDARAAHLRAALPAAPEGWRAKPDPEGQASAQNPFAAAVAAGVGSVVEREYQKEGGRGRVSVALTADSPLVQMLNVWIANPALLEAGAELVEYEAHKAVLKKSGGQLTLTILIAGAHVCEVRAEGLPEDGLFAMFDQAVVDRLAKVLGK